MDADNFRESCQLRATALRLVRCLGSRAALDYCMNNQWQGLYDEIRSLSPDYRVGTGLSPR